MWGPSILFLSAWGRKAPVSPPQGRGRLSLSLQAFLRPFPILSRMIPVPPLVLRGGGGLHLLVACWELSGVTRHLLSCSLGLGCNSSTMGKHRRIYPAANKNTLSLLIKGKIFADKIFVVCIVHLLHHLLDTEAGDLPEVTQLIGTGTGTWNHTFCLYYAAGSSSVPFPQDPQTPVPLLWLCSLVGIAVLHFQPCPGPWSCLFLWPSRWPLPHSPGLSQGLEVSLGVGDRSLEAF